MLHQFKYNEYIEKIKTKKRKSNEELEVIECVDYFESTMKMIDRQTGYQVDYALLEKAFSIAESLHRGVRRQSGELYITHPLAVMESLARVKCKVSILAAALLHDTMEDCDYTMESLRENFNEEIAEIVKAVTAIKDVEKDMELAISGMSKQELHDYFDHLTDAELIRSKYQREAFLVRFADREHNLSTIEACSPDKRRLKIAQTQTFLIPAAKRLGMRYYEIALSNYCMKYTVGNKEYSDLMNCRNSYVSVSGKTFSKFDHIMQYALNQQRFFSIPAYNPFSRYRGLKQGGVDTIQLEYRRLVKPYEIKLQLDGKHFFDRQDVYLSEILLVAKESDKKLILSQYINFHKIYLQPNGIFFEYKEESDVAITLLLTDPYENNYKVVLLCEENLESYFLGDSNGEKLILPPGPEGVIADAIRPKITVFAYSTYRKPRKFEMLVPLGATALDFAFIVSPAMACTARSARIKKWSEDISFSDDDYVYALNTILEDGDVVRFDADYEEGKGAIQNNAKVRWFNYINTEYARQKLIAYFNSQGVN